MNDIILQLIKDRLDIGAKKYGDLLDVNDGRDWIKETLEELLDSCVYLSAKIIELENQSPKKMVIEPKEVDMIVIALEEYSSNLYISGDNDKSAKYQELFNKIKKIGKVITK